ncbi:MAG: sigma-70 family RNA polymerase sigma factor, partial [Planctomycetota bacterium]
MQSSNAQPIEALLVHSDWVRHVARTLVADAAKADDLVQESWLVALRRPPRESTNLRGWLGRVVRRQALQSGRSESRRRLREERASKPEATLEDLSQRASLQKDLVAHVVALDEPFRSVVLLRFFEGLRPPQIAERLGIPPKTVHSRLARALDKLRQRLEGEYGDSQSWAIALIPLAVKPHLSSALAASSSMVGGTAKSSSPFWIMNAQVKLALAATVVALGGWGISRMKSAEAQPAPVGMVAQEGPLDEVDAGADLDVAGLDPAVPESRIETGVEPGAADEVPTSAPSDPDAATARARGSVLDCEGRPVSGVAVRVLGSADTGGTLTSGDGSFDLEFERAVLQASFNSNQTGWLVVDDPKWMTLRRSSLSASNLNQMHVVVAAPVREIEGWVRDGAGAPIPGARVALSAQGATFQSFPLPLDMTSLVDCKALTNEEGKFVLSSFPDAPRLRLWVQAKGFEGKSVSLDSASWPLV